MAEPYIFLTNEFTPIASENEVICQAKVDLGVIKCGVYGLGRVIMITFVSNSNSSICTYRTTIDRNPSWNGPEQITGFYYASYGVGSSVVTPTLIADLTVYSNLNEVLLACNDGNWDGPSYSYPITYRLTNVTTTGPNEAAVGDTVTVPLTFLEGYGVVNPSSDAYVTCNGVIVPSTYSEGQLVFTMPDPS